MHPLLSPQTLMTAYAHGIFPMADETGEIMWFSPDPRAVVLLEEFHASQTLRQLYRQGRFELTINRAFDRVIRCCAVREEGTWISTDIIEAYTRLHELGCAHSVEAWQEGELAGGLYGVAVGSVFCGESMFHRRRDASKVALVYLVERMLAGEFEVLDVQFMTGHLERFGAREIPREEYLRRLENGLRRPRRFEA